MASTVMLPVVRGQVWTELFHSKGVSIRGGLLYVQTGCSKSLNDMTKLNFHFRKTTSSPICSDLQEDVMNCYNENPKETLNCSGVVKAYSSCVQEQREVKNHVYLHKFT